VIGVDTRTGELREFPDEAARDEWIRQAEERIAITAEEYRAMEGLTRDERRASIAQMRGGSGGVPKILPKDHDHHNQRRRKIARESRKRNRK
jgi:non-ribosomal peptide synthetase component E (peptide arylation enzyme)